MLLPQWLLFSPMKPVKKPKSKLDSNGSIQDHRHHWSICVSISNGAPNVERFGTTTPELFRFADWLETSACTRVANSLRVAALTIRNTKTAPDGYYRHVAWRKGTSVTAFAITPGKPIDNGEYL